MITSQPFPDRLAIIPSETYVFDQEADPEYLSSRVVARTELSNGVEILAVNYGLIAFDFSDSALGKAERLDSNCSGEVPERVIDNHDKIVALQLNRMRFALFVAACIYGSHAHSHHRSVASPLYPGLDEFYLWFDVTDGKMFLPEPEQRQILAKLTRRRAELNKRSRADNISVAHFQVGIALADRLLTASSNYASADPVALLSMTYQAMVLHGRQHAGASVALSAVILEAAFEELMLALGQVRGTPARLPTAPASPADQQFSRRQFADMTWNRQVDHLKDAKLIDSYLADRVHEVRKARHKLMHGAEDCHPKQSGQALTVVRDVLAICTGEPCFELNTSWTYRM